MELLLAGVHSNLGLVNRAVLEKALQEAVKGLTERISAQSGPVQKQAKWGKESLPSCPCQGQDRLPGRLDRVF